MRILFLCNYYPPQHFGGYEELCRDVALGLRERGHQVTVLTSRPRPSHGSGDTVATGTSGEAPEVIRALETEVAIGDPRATSRLILCRAGRATRNRRRLAAVLAQTQPDVAVIWGLWNLAPDVAANLETALDQRVLYYVADDWPTLPQAIVQHLHAPTSNRFAAFAKSALAHGLPQSTKLLTSGLLLSHVACVSQAVLNNLTAAGVVMGEAEVIHNGIHPERFKLPTPPAPSPPPLRLILIGRLTAEKGCLVALEALTQACAAGHDLSLSLVGGVAEDMKARLNHAIDAAGLSERVQLLGHQPGLAIPGILAGHHVLIVPSQGTDALPRSAQEGMAAGLAVIASRLGGLPELIDDGHTGLLVPPGDAAALAQAIGRLAADPALRQRLAAAGRQRIEGEFDIRRTVQRVESRLLHMLDSPLAGQPRK